MWWKMLIPKHNSMMRCTWVLWSITSWSFIRFWCQRSVRVSISRCTAFAAVSVMRFFLSYVLIAIVCFVSLCYALLTIANAPCPIYRPIWKSFRLRGCCSGFDYRRLSMTPRKALSLLIERYLTISWLGSFLSTLIIFGVSIYFCIFFSISVLSKVLIFVTSFYSTFDAIVAVSNYLCFSLSSVLGWFLRLLICANS